LTEDLKKDRHSGAGEHGDDDQIVPIVASALLSSKAAEERNVEGLSGVSTRMPATNADVINEDLLAFFKGQRLSATA